MDFSSAPSHQNDFGDLIPHGTLAWAWLVVRPHNVEAGHIETPSKTSEARYLDCELTITDGPFTRRKIFTKIGRGGSEKYINMGNAALRAILEVGQGAGPQNPAGYQIDDDYGQLWDDNRGGGLKVAIKVKVEKGKGDYEDKNDVAAFLSPHPESSHKKDFDRLVVGAIAPSATAKGAGAKPPAAGPAWATPAAQTAAPAPAAAPPTQAPVQAPAQTTPPPASQTTGAKPAWLDQ